MRSAQASRYGKGCSNSSKILTRCRANSVLAGRIMAGISGIARVVNRWSRSTRKKKVLWLRLCWGKTRSKKPSLIVVFFDVLVHQLIQPAQVLNGRLTDEIWVMNLKIIKHFGDDFAFRLTINDFRVLEVEGVGSDFVHSGQPFLKWVGIRVKL